MPTKFEYPDGQSNLVDLVVWLATFTGIAWIIWLLCNVISIIKAMPDAWKHL